jgi:uncharacterized membrane protein YsdA (DUF1294 family)
MNFVVSQIDKRTARQQSISMADVYEQSLLALSLTFTSLS